MSVESTLQPVIGRLAPMTLDELDERASFLRRVDKKYVVPLDLLKEIVHQMTATHAILEIDGKRVFNYESVYFDDAHFRVFNDHRQRRRRRFKLRVRHYSDSGLCFFEMKLKGRRGRTVKHRLPQTSDQRSVFTSDAASFAEGILRADYGISLDDPMTPSLVTQFRRVTFPALDGTERVTVDFDLRFAPPSGELPTSGAASLRPDCAVVECKSSNGRGIADKLLVASGVRSVACSKYCIGMAMTRPNLRSNRWQRLIRRYFVTSAELPRGGQIETSSP